MPKIYGMQKDKQKKDSLIITFLIKKASIQKYCYTFA